MALYRKDENGVLHKIAAPVIQRWNDRIFLTEHSVSDNKDYYDLEASATKYIVSLTSYTEFQLYIADPNVTTEVYIRFNGQSLQLKRSTNEPMVIGSLFGKVHSYTLDVSTGELWTDQSVELLLVQNDIADLRAKTTSIYKYRGSLAFINLPTTGNVVGDAYNITTDFSIGGHNYLAGTNVAWNGTGWDPLSSKLPTASQIEYTGKVDALTVEEAIEVLAGDKQLLNTTGVITKTLTDKLDVTYTGAITSLTVTIPECGHGYYAGINFKVGNSLIPMNIVNNSGYPLVIIDAGVVVPSVTILTNKTYNLSFYCDGLNVYCYYIYVGV